MRLSYLLSLSMAALIASLTGYYFFFVKPDSASHTQTLFLSHPIETYIELGEIIRFDDMGNKKEQLYLHSAYHLKEHTVTHIVKPKLIQHKEGKWVTLSAKQAEAIHQGSNGKIQHIIFSKDVKITSTPFELNTSTLTYHPDLNLAKTDELIEISGQNLHIQAKGMTIHLPSGRMELLNQVTSKHVYDSI